MSAPERWYTFRYRFWYIFALPSTAGTAESKNPVVSQWMKNLSYTTALEPSGTVWHDEFGDVRAVGKTVHTLWYSLKYNPQDDRFVYRRSVDEGATWKAPVVIATGSEVPDSYLLRDENAGYLCVSGKTVHIVIARYFPEAGDTKWHWKLYYYRSTDNGASFEPGREVANSTGHHSLSQPRIACNDQRVVIGYKVAANWYDNYAIPLLISSDAGQSFRKVRTTATDAYAGNFEDLALNGTDIYVLHYRLLEPYYYGNFQARIGICSSSNDGASFTNRWLTTPAADKRYYALSTKDQYYAPDLAVVGSTKC